MVETTDTCSGLVDLGIGIAFANARMRDNETITACTIGGSVSEDWMGFRRTTEFAIERDIVGPLHRMMARLVP